MVSFYSYACLKIVCVHAHRRVHGCKREVVWEINGSHCIFFDSSHWNENIKLCIIIKVWESLCLCRCTCITFAGLAALRSTQPRLPDMSTSPWRSMTPQHTVSTSDLIWPGPSRTPVSLQSPAHTPTWSSSSTSVSVSSSTSEDDSSSDYNWEWEFPQQQAGSSSASDSSWNSGEERGVVVKEQNYFLGTHQGSNATVYPSHPSPWRANRICPPSHLWWSCMDLQIWDGSGPSSPPSSPSPVPTC